MSLTPANSKERFSSRVADYVRYRPGYPATILDALRDECGLTPESVIADAGSGTGLLARLFLENGNVLFGVEPNAEMRAAGEEYLRNYPKFHSVAGSAEATTLAAASVDFVIVGQAFHWFDPIATRKEFARILRPGGCIAVVWNERRVETSGLLRAYEALLREYSSDYAQVSARYPEDQRMAEFFAPGESRQRTFSNEQIFDFEGLRGRLLSSSYSPPKDHPNHEPMLAELRRIFDAHSENGYARIEYTTHLYYGRLEK
ncbi:MAG: class I SAM-dependent methyltransferase [Acidobacteriota bacterium]|nr:class I SAM-dependent methyltransferase [Acidobacteriota bacterium]